MDRCTAKLKRLGKKRRLKWLGDACAKVESLQNLPAAMWQSEWATRAASRSKPPPSFRDPVSGTVAGNMDQVVDGFAHYCIGKSSDPRPLTREVSQRHDVIRSRMVTWSADHSPLDDEISLDEVLKAIQLLRATSAGGPDQIHPWFIHYASPDLSVRICELLNVIWDSGEVPDAWKLGDVTYCLKPGPGRVPSCPGDNRPITMVDSLFKVLERILNQRLMLWCERRRVLSDAQNGFRWRRSTIDNLLYLTEMIRMFLARKKPLYGVFVDVAAAYDSVDRNVLLESLAERVGVRGKMFRMCRALMDRVSRRVKMAGHTSVDFILDLGVAQGSVLSPIFFDIFFDPLVRCLEGTGLGVCAHPFMSGPPCQGSPLAFADDALFLTDDITQIQPILDRIAAVGDERRLTFGAGGKKCAVVMFAPDGPDRTAFLQRSWSLGNITVPAVDTYRYHGLHIGKCTQSASGLARIDWSLAVSEKCASFRSRTFHLLRSTCNPVGHTAAATVKFLKAELLPILEYGVGVMDLTPQQIAKMSELQWWAVRQFLCCSRDRARLPDSVLVTETGLMPWYRRRHELIFRFVGRLLLNAARATMGSPRDRLGSIRSAQIVNTWRSWFSSQFQVSVAMGSFSRLSWPPLPPPTDPVELGRWTESTAAFWWWDASIVSSFVSLFRDYSLCPSWRHDSLPLVRPGSLSEPALLADTIRCEEARNNDKPLSMKERQEHFYRELIWAHCLPRWQSRMSCLKRVRNSGWNLLLSGPTPSSLHRAHISPRGELVQRSVRMGTLPIGVELNSINSRCSSVCFCCSGNCPESLEHILFYCPAFADLREDLNRAAFFNFQTIPFLLRSAQGAIDVEHRMAMFTDLGPPAWPKRSPLPAHADCSTLPALGLALSRLPPAVRLQWRRDVCNFLVKLWGRRISLVKQNSPAVCLQNSLAVKWMNHVGDGFMSSLLHRPEYGRS